MSWSIPRPPRSDSEQGRGSSVEYRRRAQRQPTAWAGFCHIDGEPPAEVAGLRGHRRLDVCGLGITFHPSSALGVGATGASLSTCPPSATRSTSGWRARSETPRSPSKGDIRVGIEFVGPLAGRTGDHRGPRRHQQDRSRSTLPRMAALGLSRSSAADGQRIPLEELPHRLVRVRRG